MARRRWLLILVGLPIYAAAITWLTTAMVILIFASGDLDDSSGKQLAQLLFVPSHWDLSDEAWLMCCCLPAGILVVSQLMFALPILKPRPLQAGRAKSLRTSLVAAAFVAANLCVALVLTILGLIQLILSMGFSVDDDPGESIDIDSPLPVFAAWLLVLFGSWIFWSALFFLYARRRQGHGVLGRVLGMLLGGTIIETVLVLPVDIMLRRRTDCYCSVGSFWSLCLSGWALLWLAGPGMAVLFFKKRHRAWFETNCAMCGYAKGPTPSACCPECGHDWTMKTEKAKQPNTQT